MAKSAQAFRTIREVADWLDVAAHVLRFWESKFSQIKPVKRAGGRRYYRPVDMELVGGIKVLLHDRGLTIRGVQKMISDEGVDAVMALSPPIDGILGEDAQAAADGAEVVDLKPAAEPDEAVEAAPATPQVSPASDRPKTEAPQTTSPETSATPPTPPSEPSDATPAMTPARAPDSQAPDTQPEPQPEPDPEPAPASTASAPPPQAAPETLAPSAPQAADPQPALPLDPPAAAVPQSSSAALAKLAQLATDPTRLPPDQLTAQIGALRMLGARMTRGQTHR
ncbi:MerR family transcriptional regulator [Gymnodinialimonas sp. 2305UL16-5]|uniref:MerR family transcriptional regulator n=1 Tax=Gymnodinialimonas mytili TaxID=3126503 RepID=UPI0030B67BD5